jgi:hypothetical protein
MSYSESINKAGHPPADLTFCSGHHTVLWNARGDYSVLQVRQVATSLKKEFQGRAYDLLVSHTTIVFTRHILLAWQHRQTTDQRYFGGLFYLLCDESARLTGLLPCSNWWN